MTFAAERDALFDTLIERPWSFWVTLAFNDPDGAAPHESIAPPIMRERLRDWDARMNRALIGPKWMRRPDERIQWIFMPELIDRNPH
tara:strand:- start:2489 stop:2749 length:261 start_codon:yes stop_codon:yes gene_type:complete